MDSAAALFSVMSALCYLAALRNFVGLPASIIAALALLLLQYLTLSRLHPKRDERRGIEARELEDFLHNLSVKLSHGLSFEASFQEATREHGGILKPALAKASRELSAGRPPEEALRHVYSKLTSSEAKRLLYLVPRLVEYNSRRAGKVLSRVVALLERNRALKEKLRSSVKREELKVRVMSTLYPATLAALYYLARQVSALTKSFEELELLSLNLSLVSLSAIAPFYATLAVMGEKPLQYSLLSLSVYIVLQILLAGLGL